MEISQKTKWDLQKRMEQQIITIIKEANASPHQSPPLVSSLDIPKSTNNLGLLTVVCWQVKGLISILGLCEFTRILFVLLFRREKKLEHCIVKAI